MRLAPSPSVNVIPVEVSIVTPYLKAVISPNNEYVFISELVESQVTVNSVSEVDAGSQVRVQVTLGVSDQM